MKCVKNFRNCNSDSDISVPTSGILAEHIYQRNTVLASGKGSTGYSEEFLELQQFEGKRTIFRRVTFLAQPFYSGMGGA